MKKPNRITQYMNIPLPEMIVKEIDNIIKTDPMCFRSRPEYIISLIRKDLATRTIKN